MATRLYLPASTAADVSPSFRGTWSSTTGAVRRKMVETKGSSAIGFGSSITTLDTAGNSALDRQYVSNPLDAATLLGTTLGSGSLMAKEGNAAHNIDIAYMTLFLVSNDGATVRADLYGWNAYGTYLTELTDAVSGRNTILMSSGTFDVATYGSTGGNVTITAGDRLVLEIGYAHSGAGSSSTFTCKYGENATDLPADDETQTSDGAGWFELSQTLTFQAAGGDIIDPYGTNGVWGL